MTATTQNLNEHDIVVPEQHALIHEIDAAETYLFGGRGTFKSSVGLSLFNIRRVFEMPRSTGVGVGITFNNLYENTVPPMKAFLLSKGFVEGVHFTINTPPPKNWPSPYLGVVDKSFKNMMCWYNGTVKQYVSLRRKASANGVSAQWGDFDEVKFMDEKELVDEIFPIFRGNEKYFKNCSGYMSKFFATDKKADPAQIKWLLKKRELVNENKVKVVISLARYLNQLKEQYNNATKSRKGELSVEIHAIETRLSILRSNMVYVAEIGADDVRPILGNKWYKDKERNSSAFEWKTIYKNEDPDKPEISFYPGFDINVHVNDNEVLKNKPFIIAADFQHKVIPIPVAQLGRWTGSDRLMLQYVNAIHTLYPQGLEDAVNKFCDEHSDHPYKQVYYIYDHTAVAERVDAKEYYKIVIDTLRKRGWTVWPLYTGQAPSHYQKYIDTDKWLKGKDTTIPAIGISRKCKKLIASISGAAAYQVRNETKKDKRPEQDERLDQSETTHFSDVFDMINDGVIKRKLIRDIIEPVQFGFK
jgi:hypothetical protein